MVILKAGAIALRLCDLRAFTQHTATAPSNFTVAGWLAMCLDSETIRV